MQDGYIRAVDYDVDSFWEESNRLAGDHCMDQNLAYMYKMLQSARGKEILNKERLKQYGGKVRLYDGIRGWFRRINAYGERRGILVEHYIISSGLREIIEERQSRKISPIFMPVPFITMSMENPAGRRR